MTKTIKVEQAVYDRLDRFRGKRETFSQAVERLLTLLDRVGELRAVLEGQIEYAAFQKQRLKAQADSLRTGEGQHEDPDGRFLDAPTQINR